MYKESLVPLVVGMANTAILFNFQHELIIRIVIKQFVGQYISLPIIR